MAKSYRKTNSNRSSRRYSSSTPATAVGSLKWTVIGIFVGLIVAVVIFWEYAPELAGGVNKLKPETLVTHTKTAAKKEAVSQQASTASQSHAPQFDFYTMLPQMQVAPNTQAATQKQQPPPNMPPTMPAAPPASATSAAAPMAPQTVAAAPAQTAQTENVAASPAITPTMVTKAEAATLGTTPNATADTNNTKPTAPPPSTTENAAPAPESDQATAYILQVASVKDYHVADRLKAELTMMGYNVTIQKTVVNGQSWNRVNVGPFSSKKVALEKQQALHENNISSMLIKQS